MVNIETLHLRIFRYYNGVLGDIDNMGYRGTACTQHLEARHANIQRET